VRLLFDFGGTLDIGQGSAAPDGVGGSGGGLVQLGAGWRPERG
jgi:hypothetical protein